MWSSAIFVIHLSYALRYVSTNNLDILVAYNKWGLLYVHCFCGAIMDSYSTDLRPIISVNSFLGVLFVLNHPLVLVRERKKSILFP